MRLRGRTDANQKEVVKQLRQIGCSVVVTSQVGNGFPDVVVGRNKVTLLLEIKDGSKPPSGRTLTDEELTFVMGWRGQIMVVYSPQEAVNYVLANS